MKSKQIKEELKSRKFMKERKEHMKKMYKLFKPNISYSKEYDILFIGFSGNLKCESTVELTNDFRIDVAKDGTVIGIEIENLSKHLKENNI